MYPLGEPYSQEQSTRDRTSPKSRQCKRRSYFLSLAYYGCRDTNRRCPTRHIAYDNSISTNHCMIANRYRAQYLRPRADIDMPPEDWHTFMVLTDRNLLKQQAIGTNFCIGMYNDAIGMGYQKTAAYLTIQRDVCTGDNTPESMAQHGNHFDPYG